MENVPLINLISLLLFPAIDGEPACSHQDVEYK